MNAISVTSGDFKDGQKKLEKAVGGSFYGRNMMIGLNSMIDHAGCLEKIKIIFLAISGTFFISWTTYFSIDGAVRMVKWSIEQRIDGHPLPSDIGHGGEWFQQPFQDFLFVHIVISVVANNGHLSKVKRIYAKLIDKIIKSERPVDFSSLYSRFVDDIHYLAKRSFGPSNIFAVKKMILKICEEIDTEVSPCLSLELDRSLQEDYEALLKKFKKLDNWNPNSIRKNWQVGIRQLGKRGVGQAIEKGIFFSIFQVVILVTMAFMAFGLTRVVDEVFISKNSMESSGHLAEWTTTLLASLTLLYLPYLLLIKREALLVRTHRVMDNHLQKTDVDKPARKERLIEMMNIYLDHLADKCHFTHLPSSYRINTEPDEIDGPSLD